MSQGPMYIFKVNQFSMEVAEGNTDLEYSDEDVKSSCTFVLFCPCKILEDGTMIKYTDFDDPRTYTPFFLPLSLFFFLRRSSSFQTQSHITSIQIPQNTQNLQSQKYSMFSSGIVLNAESTKTLPGSGSRWQHPNHNIHLISHPQTSRARGKTTRPLPPRLRRKSRHHGEYRRDRLRSCREDIRAAR